MPYLGQKPKESFDAAISQTITGTGATSYSLTRAVNNPEELEVFINNVQQQPTASYTVSGSTITFDEALLSSDSCYVVFRSVTQTTRSVSTATINDDAVTSAKIASNAVTVGKLATSGTLPALNGSALTSVIPEGPAFYANLSANQNLSSNVTTTLAFAAEGYDTDGCYNNTGSTVTLNGISTPAYSFAPNVAGYYSIHLQTRPQVLTSKQVAYVFTIRKNASTSISTGQFDANMGGSTDAMYFSHTILVAMNGTSDYIDFRGYQYNYTSPTTLYVSSSSGHTYAYGHLVLKL
tara:strand:- start:391 stop:1269 length:879 start_codon:yes stop_codon:yes gene_type:complete